MTTTGEPNLTTDSELHDVLEQLKSREPIFHRPEFGTTRADFERITVPDFWEVGASGKRYSRDYVLAELDRRYADEPYPDHWQSSDFYCRKLAQDVYMLTYTLLQQADRKTRRTTIWQHTAEGWKIVYHQGTLVQED